MSRIKSALPFIQNEKLEQIGWLDKFQIKMIESKPVTQIDIQEDYEKWLEEENNRLALKTLGKIKKICKIRVMSGYIFRKSNPAVLVLRFWAEN